MALLSRLDPLCCQEESLELEEERKRPMLALLEEPEAVMEEEWAEVLCSLVAKDEETRPELLPGDGGDEAYLLSLRREVVAWVVHAAANHDFSVVTTFLAVNYLDRCFVPHAAAGGLRLQSDKVWMGRLPAVAALSLAAKVEETRVPLLLDLQVAMPLGTEEENRYVFEAKTIRRMELLLLSALSWRMNSVTPLSFLHHLLPRLCSISTTAAASAARVQELLGDSEAALLSVVADWRWVRYPASVWAAAALLHAAEGGAGAIAATASVSQVTHHLISLLHVPKVWLLRLFACPDCLVLKLHKPIKKSTGKGRRM
ncbi:Cyclin, N-terminal domain [Musa troglodytarum]|uniref:Cyclin, N-terminal domain n=1 Tax=Musa troglodytarum TaxID=320322 RepID=A0A9E7F8D0_9LILI|nr:Cyclin, N-terminal domain [Musa troglodytarum]